MTDLLAQVKASIPGADSVARFRGDEEAVSEPEDQEMATFFSKVAEVREKMAGMSVGQQELTRLHEESKTAVQTERTQAIRAAMAQQTEQIKKQAKIVKNDLDFLDALNERALDSPENGSGSAAERTRTTITNSLKKKLSDLMQDFTALRNNIMNQYRDVVDRRYYTVTGEKASDEQIDQLIETGEAENLFQKAILAQGRGRLLDTLNEINERHEAVKELNKSLLELHQMFLDMAVLVEQQGVMLDNIEKQVSRAVDHVQQGTKNLENAKNLGKNTRKWMCCALVVLLIIAAIIVVVVFLQSQ